MKKTTYMVTRFDIDEEFYVEVSPSKNKYGDDLYDFVLCKENYGIKNYMFCLSQKDCPPSEWENIILENVYEHIELYNEEAI